MLKAETVRVAGYVCAATLFSSAALTFPFAALAQDVTQKTAQSAAQTQPAQNSAAQTQPAQNSAAQTQPAQSVVSPAAPVSAAPATQPTVTCRLVDGKDAPRPIALTGATVADVLHAAGISLSPADRVSPALTTHPTAATVITVTRVHFDTQTVTKSIPYRTVFAMSNSVPAGTIRPGHKGVPGIRTLTYRTGYVNGAQTSRWLVSSVVTRKPVDQQNLGGYRVRMAAALPSRGGTYNRLGSMSMIATGYSPYEGSGSGRCATGMRAGYGVVAVDPRVIRLGTRLFISGYGYAVAGDTGGAIKGHRIDLGSATYREAARVGRRRVNVWVLGPSRSK